MPIWLFWPLPAATDNEAASNIGADAATPRSHRYPGYPRLDAGGSRVVVMTASCSSEAYTDKTDPRPGGSRTPSGPPASPAHWLFFNLNRVPPLSFLMPVNDWDGIMIFCVG